jgi:hypothetical protein
MAFQSVLLCRDPAAMRRARRLLEGLHIGADVCAPPERASELLEQGNYDAVIVAADDLEDAGLLLRRFSPVGVDQPMAFAILAPFRNEASKLAQTLECVTMPAPSTSGIRTPERRHCRHKVQSIAYVTVDRSNGGIIRDLSEDGMAMQAVAPVQLDQVVNLRFELLNPRTRIETTGKVTWANQSGQAGVHFLDLSVRTTRLLKDWLLINLLVSANDSFVADSILQKHPAEEVQPERIGESVAQPEPPERRKAEGWLLSWWPAPISYGTVAALADSMIVLAAVLLFAIVFVLTAGHVPSWPMFTLLTVGITAFFAGVYHYLFVGLAAGTPGTQWAGLAAEPQRD